MHDFARPKIGLGKHSEILIWRWGKYFLEVVNFLPNTWITFLIQSTDAQWSLLSSKSKLLGICLGQTIWADKFWDIWGIFGRFISTHFGTVCPCFLLINHYFDKKLSLYIQIANIYLDLDLNLGRKELGI